MEYAMKGNFTCSEVLIYLLKIYKRVVSPLLPPLCRFQPTCSEYMIEAVRKQGTIKGLIMGCARILRCNPFCRGGFDPVPDKFSVLKNNQNEDKI